MAFFGKAKTKQKQKQNKPTKRKPVFRSLEEVATKKCSYITKCRNIDGNIITRRRGPDFGLPNMMWVLASYAK